MRRRPALANTALACLALLVSALMAAPAAAQGDAFRAGPVIADFGRVVPVESDWPIPKGTIFRVDFDVSEAGKEGALNRRMESAARFLNMHAAAGVPRGDLHVALVVHGPALFDLASDAAYARAHPGKANPDHAMIAALVAARVEIIACGQSAAAQGIAKADLLPGVRLSLSAMTAHALLQQQGYVLMP